MVSDVALDFAGDHFGDLIAVQRFLECCQEVEDSEKLGPAESTAIHLVLYSLRPLSVVECVRCARTAQLGDRGPTEVG